MNFLNQIISLRHQQAISHRLESIFKWGFPNLTPQTHREVTTGSSRNHVIEFVRASLRDQKLLLKWVFKS
jgi:hypothetical protein